MFKAIADIPILNAIVQVVMAIYCQPCLVAYNAMSTYALTGSLKMAVVGAVAAIIAPGGGDLLSIAMSAVIGGVSAEMMGGDFHRGFIAAGIGAGIGGGQGIENPYVRVAVAAVVGGTTSTIMGGKFANGAITAGFAAAVKAARNGDFDEQAKARKPPINNRALTGDEIAQAKKNFNKAAPEAYKDYKKGVFKDNGIDVIQMEESDIQFVDEYKMDGESVLGVSQEYDARSHYEVKFIKITARGCVTMSECYATLAHEFAHMTADNINMDKGWGPDIYDNQQSREVFNSPPSNQIQMMVNARRGFQESHAEVKGLWYAEYKGH
ncbi:hypothetical protein [uncultured Shewanella sp.]|uniref:hypothetical protein n=1 Tax=uncultured Shewanella sp. TaxID=173975 RepID=UPI00260584DC|nr:hypothetical protein [uncultured Shewanella sp.]